MKVVKQFKFEWSHKVLTFAIKSFQKILRFEWSVKIIEVLIDMEKV